MTPQERASAGSECIDVETLAAWSEGVLPPSERSMVEAHAARCVRCQEMLAVMARTAPVEAAGGSWSLRHWIMMLAPAATATAAVILWFAIEPRPPASDAPVHQVAANTEVDKLTSPQVTAAPVAPAETAAPTREDRAASDRSPAAKEKEAGPPARLAEAKDSDRYLRQNQQPAKSTAESTTASTRARQELAAAADEEQRRKVGAAGERSASGALADAKASSRPAPKPSDAAAAPSSVVAETPSLPVPPPPPPATPPPPAAPVSVTPPSAQARAAQTQTGQTQQSSDVQKSAGQTAAFGGDAGRSGGTLNRATLNESVSIATLAIGPAGASVQWRVLSGHIVQHSVDKGATWTTQYTLDETAQLAAGSAPSSTTAWFVGRGGLVVATADGRIWRRVAFPEAIDLTGVVATDARVAIVTSADRRVFTTTDGGASWSPRKN